jgi:hypothetical protein
MKSPFVQGHGSAARSPSPLIDVGGSDPVGTSTVIRSIAGADRVRRWITG